MTLVSRKRSNSRGLLAAHNLICNSNNAFVGLTVLLSSENHIVKMAGLHAPSAGCVARSSCACWKADVASDGDGWLAKKDVIGAWNRRRFDVDTIVRENGLRTTKGRRSFHASHSGSPLFAMMVRTKYTWIWYFDSSHSQFSWGWRGWTAQRKWRGKARLGTCVQCVLLQVLL